jgi:uncharacterized protein
MDSSRYNLFFKIEDNRYLLLNLFSRSKLFVDDELKDVLEKSNFDDVTEDILNQLVRCGVVVDSRKSELTKFRDMYQKRVYLPFEYEFTIIPTYDCNVSCYYCNHSRETITPVVIQEFKKFFAKELGNTECENVAVRIGGGEPLLYPELVCTLLEDLSQITHDCGKKFFSGLSTNGTLLTHNILERLPFLNAVQVTFEGSRTYHDTVRHDHNKTFDRVVKSAQFVRDAGILLNVRIHVSENNITGLEELFCELHSSGLLGPKTMLTVAAVVPTRICPFYPSKCTEDNTSDLILKTWQIAQDCGITLSGLPSPVYEMLPCPYVTPTSLIVTPDGTFYNCLMAAGEEILQAGSVEKGIKSPQEVLPWQSTECESCHYLVLCGGYCAWKKHVQKGTCNTRSLLEERVKTHVKNTYLK